MPPIKCQGIKTRLVSFIRETVHPSPTGRWIEPFLGSGVVAFNLAPEHALLTDKNPYVIRLYQGIQNGKYTGEVIRAFLEKHDQFLQQDGASYYATMRDSLHNMGISHDFGVEHDYLCLPKQDADSVQHIKKTTDLGEALMHGDAKENTLTRVSRQGNNPYLDVTMNGEKVAIVPDVWVREALKCPKLKAILKETLKKKAAKDFFCTARRSAGTNAR